MSLFDISKLKIELNKLEEKTNNPEFWQNIEESGKVTKQINGLKSKSSPRLKKIINSTGTTLDVLLLWLM